VSITLEVTLASSGPTGIEVPPEVVESFNARRVASVIEKLGG